MVEEELQDEQVGEEYQKSGGDEGEGLRGEKRNRNNVKVEEMRRRRRNIRGEREEVERKGGGEEQCQ